MAKEDRSSSVEAELLETDVTVDIELEDGIDPAPRMVSGFVSKGSAEKLERAQMHASGAESRAVPHKAVERPKLELVAAAPAATPMGDMPQTGWQRAPGSRRIAVLVVLLAVVLGSGLGYWFRVGRPSIQPSPKAALAGVTATQVGVHLESIAPKLDEVAAMRDDLSRAPQQPARQIVRPVVGPVSEESKPVPRKRFVKAQARVLGRRAIAEKARSGPTRKAELPNTLTRAQVRAGFEAARGTLSGCSGGMGGQLEVTATISSTGRVTHAVVGGDYSGKPAGSCMARAVRGAKFPAFIKGPIRVQYPFTL